MTKDKSLSTKPYRGTKDYFPKERRLIAYLFDKWRQSAEAFGYEEYQAPFLEPLELYLSKTSEEIVREQLYHLEDKGERKLAIRPEMTPSLARMVAQKAPQLQKPIRWYSIATCMRFERPQRSRLRQFDQFNLDSLGGDPLFEDIEVLQTIVHMMASLGAEPCDFRICLNHRELVNQVLARVGLMGTAASETLRLLDHAGKMEPQEFLFALKEKGLKEDQALWLRDFMEVKFEGLDKFIEDESPAFTHVQQVMAGLKKSVGRFSESIEFSAHVMRGFDYYTGLVFEVFDTHPTNRRALFGGGRYDNLVASFGGDALSGVGYGVSEISLVNFLEVHEKLPELDKGLDIYMFGIGEKAAEHLLPYAMEARFQGLKVEMAGAQKKFGKAMGQADKSQALVAMFCGEDEMANGTVSVKWLSTKSQEEISVEHLGEFFSKLQHKGGV